MIFPEAVEAVTERPITSDMARIWRFWWLGRSLVSQAVLLARRLGATRRLRVFRRCRIAMATALRSAAAANTMFSACTLWTVWKRILPRALAGRTQAQVFRPEGLRELPPLRAAYLAKNFTTETSCASRLRSSLAGKLVDPDGDNPAIRAFVETADGERPCHAAGERGSRHHPARRIRQCPIIPTVGAAAEISSDLRKAEAEARARKRGAWGLRRIQRRR